jgi:hypothetical protein
MNTPMEESFPPGMKIFRPQWISYSGPYGKQKNQTNRKMKRWNHILLIIRDPSESGYDQCGTGSRRQPELFENEKSEE